MPFGEYGRAPRRARGRSVSTTPADARLGCSPGRFLRATLDRLGLSQPGLGWYEATRHTFASQWVLANGSIEKLKEILGHYSVVITERYAHLRPDLFSARDLGAISLDLAPGDATPTPGGQRLGSAGAGPARKML
ncbi:MAG TPA: hypothetical protein VFP50_10585 [Anaeromyxobacteraceae bacterium]|nr:hypothetical protein [Anaeromyxobacteraceae bacterium]